MAMTIKELIESFKGLDENTPVVVTFEYSNEQHFITGVYGEKDDGKVELEISSVDDDWFILSKDNTNKGEIQWVSF